MLWSTFVEAKIAHLDLKQVSGLDGGVVFSIAATLFDVVDKTRLQINPQLLNP